MQLSSLSQRILGALIEKEMATPQSYPLSVNALRSACNQSTNRDPITDHDEPTISAGLKELAGASLVKAAYARRSSTPRYEHTLGEHLEIGPAAIGLGRLRWRPDILGGIGLAALIGIPGLLFYLGARALGMNAEVEPAALSSSWWRIPVLVLAAFANGFAEEVVVVGYLITRLRQLGMTPSQAVLTSSVLRGIYHLYQGFGAGLGNVVMGLVFGYAWCRTGRLWPLVFAHGIINTVAFVGYVLLAGHLGWLR